MYEIQEPVGQAYQKPPEKNPLKPHGCPRCTKSFSSVHQLAQHTRVHTGEKPYKCPYCDRRFKQQSHVKQHSRLHTGERPYKCSEPSCGRSFVQLSNLLQHMGHHANPEHKVKETNHHCQICGKGFTTESSLSLHHTKKHSEVNGDLARPTATKKFICNICNKSYTTESALQIHSSKHKANCTQQIPKEEPGISCRLCPETFISVEGLDEHVKVAHPVEASRLHHTPLHIVTSSPVPYYPPPSHQMTNPASVSGVSWFDPFAYPISPPPCFAISKRDVK